MKFDQVPDIAKYLSLVFFLYWIGGMMVWNFLPIYFERHIQNVFWIGVLTSLPALIPVLIDIPVGNLVQRTGGKTVIFLGFVIGVLPAIFYITAVPILLAAGKVAEGFNKSMIWSGSWSMSMSSSKEDTESESLSVFLLGNNLALVLGPVIGGYLIMSYGFQLPLLLWYFTAMLTLLVFYLYIGLEGKRGFVDSMDDILHREAYKNDISHLKEHWQDIKLPLTLISFYSVFFTFFWLAIPLTLESLDVGFGMMGLIFGLAAIPYLFQYWFGEIADSIGEIKTVFMLSALIAPLLIAMGFASSWPVLAVLYFVTMSLVVGISPPLHSLYDKRTPTEYEGEMVGFLEMFKHSGQAFGPIMAGAVASVYGMYASFWAASLFAIAVVIMTFRHL